MRVAFFSAHRFDRQFFDEANGAHRHDLEYLEARLTPATCALAHGRPAVCAFVNDQLNADVLTQLSAGGTRLIALRSAGFNHVDSSPDSAAACSRTTLVRIRSVRSWESNTVRSTGSGPSPTSSPCTRR